MKYTVKTFGCKVNTYDTSLIQKQLDNVDEGHHSSSSVPYHIVNTCAVTETAITESLRWIRRYKKKNPHTKIVVTGCGVQAELKHYSHYCDAGDVDLVIANSHKNEIAEILKKDSQQNQQQKVFHSNIFKQTHKGEGGQVESHHTRLFLKIQDGCNQFCTFCIIPFARGRSRSLSIRHLVNQINHHHSQGVLEVVLTGVHIGDYQDPDTKKGLSELVKNILQHTSIPRIRLSSLEPIEVTDALLSLYQDKRMCPHFHLSIQSGSSKVLKDMKRHYGHKDVKKCLNQIAKQFSEVFVGMDMIAGFPGESQSDFEETYELLQQTPWTKIHVFPYSPRPKTYAIKREDHCSRSVIQKRASLLRHLSHHRYQEMALAQIGKNKQILPLKKDSISRDYWMVQWNALPNESPVKTESNPQEETIQLTSWNCQTNQFTAQRIN